MKPSVRSLLTILRIVFGFALLVYLMAIGVIDWTALLGLANAWPISLIALSLLLVDMGLTSWRLCVLLKPHNLNLTLRSSFRLTFIGIFFNTCLPGATGGDMVRIYYAMEHNHGRRAEIATIMLLDRVVGMFALMLVPLLVAPLFGPMIESMRILRGLLWTAATAVIGLTAGMVFCSTYGVRNSRIITWIFRKLPLGSYLQRIFDTLYTYRGNRGALLAAVGISLVIHAISIAVTLMLIEVTSSTGAAWPMVILIPLGFTANALPVTPGGLGVGEAVFGSLFDMAGLTGGVEALLGWRLLMLLLGLVGLGFYLQGGHRFVHERPALEREQNQRREAEGQVLSQRHDPL